ncbi:hypothetical protein [Amaricoccus tamworthensis]
MSPYLEAEPVFGGFQLQLAAFAIIAPRRYGLKAVTELDFLISTTK